MVKHIVMWNFKSEIAEAERPALKQRMDEALTGLVGQVPGLIDAVFVQEPIKTSTHHMSLITTFDSISALEGYKDHPAHVQVANECVRPYTTERACMDYEM